MKASSKAGVLNTMKRVYTRSRTIRVARAGNKVTSTKVSSPLEACRSICCWAAMVSCHTKERRWIEGNVAKANLLFSKESIKCLGPLKRNHVTDIRTWRGGKL